MFIKCSWCGKDMGEKEPFHDNRTTHTICPGCMCEERKKIALIRAKGLGFSLVEKKSVDLSV